MPGFDRTGPDRMGPMTGRGMGPCGGGRARGFGRGRRYLDRDAYPTARRLTEEEEKASLMADLKELEDSKREMESRLKKLEGKG
ncbi:DUF5320 domain-containing protein [Candidatus Woesearchaeota archaeon]|nr:DUF5320 domain-containing protein [Candidatus Woesearchaeota archaeon]